MISYIIRGFESLGSHTLASLVVMVKRTFSWFFNYPIIVIVIQIKRWWNISNGVFIWTEIREKLTGLLSLSVNWLAMTWCNEARRVSEWLSRRLDWFQTFMGQKELNCIKSGRLILLNFWETLWKILVNLWQSWLNSLGS